MFVLARDFFVVAHDRGSTFELSDGRHFVQFESFKKFHGIPDANVQSRCFFVVFMMYNKPFRLKDSLDCVFRINLKWAIAVASLGLPAAGPKNHAMCLSRTSLVQHRGVELFKFFQ